MDNSTCRLEYCDLPLKNKTHQLCRAHETQLYRGNGFKPLTARALPDVERFWLSVNKTNACWLWTASVTSQGYGQFQFNSKNRLAHRVSYILEHGELPAGQEIDHICHTRTCVRPEHLRLASRKQNAENHLGAQANSRSNVRGVYRRSDTGRWTAEVVHAGIKHRLGCFDDMALAEAAVRSKRNELFTHNDFDRRDA